MKPVYQTRFGDPAGNCTEAALASLLGCELSDVPDLWELSGRPTEPGARGDGLHCWRSAIDAWLAQRGLALVEMNGPVDSWWLPDGLLMMAHGPGVEGGLPHVVVMRAAWAERDDLGGCRRVRLDLVHNPHAGWGELHSIEGLSFVVLRGDGRALAGRGA